jgi:hypothetical protein
MKRFACVLLLTSVVGCGDDGGKTPPADAAPMVPAHIMVTGTTKSVSAGGSSPLAGVTVGAYTNADETTAVATATSDQAGNYTLDITTNGMPVDGFIKATLATYMDTYLYAPAPLVADYSGAAMNLVTSQTLGALSTICGHGITTDMGAVGVEAVDGTGALVVGAALSSTPAPVKYCYDGSNGLPASAQTVTGADGLGYLVDISGSVSVTATMSGLTFGTHTIKVRVGTLTTTLVQGH